MLHRLFFAGGVTTVKGVSTAPKLSPSRLLDHAYHVYIYALLELSNGGVLSEQFERFGRCRVRRLDGSWRLMEVFIGREEMLGISS